MYIIFEGVDTTGKSTQIDLLRKKHNDIITLKEPGGTKLGENLRDIILNHDHKLSASAELFLFLADRAENFEKNIAKNMDKIVISDRGMISGIAYALANHENLDMDFLIQLNKFALNGSLPDKVVLFRTDEKLIKQRLSAKTHDNIELRGIKYLLRVQDLMIEVLDKLPIKILVVDASETIENIYNEIEEFVYDTSA